MNCGRKRKMLVVGLVFAVICAVAVGVTVSRTLFEEIPPSRKLNQIKTSNLHYSRVITPKRLIFATTQVRRNVAEVASHWPHCVQFDRPGNFNPDLPHRQPERLATEP